MGVASSFICMFMLLLFYSLINCHLLQILKFTRTIDYTNLDTPLVLYKKHHQSNKMDELDRIVLAINEMQQRLQEQQSQTRLLAKVFESSLEGICVTKKSGEIVAVNNAFSHITGYSETEVLGGNPRILQSHQHDEIFYQQMWQSLHDSGQWRGEIWNKRKNGEIYPQLTTLSSIKDAAGNTSNYVAVFTDISKLKETMSQLEYLAHHNPLTDLPNRLLLKARLDYTLQQVKRDKGHGAVLFIDLDNFKKINDSLGHDAGDKVLKQVAERLRGICREIDTVAHLGGDEFVVVLSNLHTDDDATDKAQQIVDELARPYNLDDFEMFVSASVGIIDFDAESEGANSLLKKADAAMYEAKGKGKGCYHLYTAELDDKALNKIVLEAQLRQGLERGEFELYYQPQVLLADMTIVSCEALVRWNNPEQGLLMPDNFIPLSEETGLILPLGEWVLRTACKQFVLWNEMGLGINRIAVNLSGKQIHAKEIPALVVQVLTETHCPPTALELEITEGFIMSHPLHSIEVLEQIKALGVTLSVDDFGTGHSSLRHLKQLPVDRVKIDKSFVWDVHENKQGEAIALAVIELGHSVGLQIIAEGVETKEQSAFLQEHGCDEVQGYLYSRPVPAQQMTELLREGVQVIQLETD
ncbi:MAG: EAL domain-containing protein [Thermodesulfobacteriota bacterium]|nr:EAL domain-containing protein [Thermodesulfobacteriota bacterium]